MKRVYNLTKNQLRNYQLRNLTGTKKDRLILVDKAHDYRRVRNDNLLENFYFQVYHDNTTGVTLSLTYSRPVGESAEFNVRLKLVGSRDSINKTRVRLEKIIGGKL